MKYKNNKEKKELKEAKKFLWILEEFQKMDKEEQDYFLDYLKGKIDILGRTIKWENKK